MATFDFQGVTVDNVGCNSTAVNATGKHVLNFNVKRLLEQLELTLDRMEISIVISEIFWCRLVQSKKLKQKL